MKLFLDYLFHIMLTVIHDLVKLTLFNLIPDTLCCHILQNCFVNLSKIMILNISAATIRLIQIYDFHRAQYSSTLSPF